MTKPALDVSAISVKGRRASTCGLVVDDISPSCGAYVCVHSALEPRKATIARLTAPRPNATTSPQPHRHLIPFKLITNDAA